MSPQEAKDIGSTGSVRATSVDMKLEVIVIPVANVDRAKDFYASLGWRLDADRTAGTHFAWSNSRLPVPPAQSNSALASRQRRRVRSSKP